MRSLFAIFVAPVILACAFWGAFAACVDEAPDVPPAAARVLVAWDPLACQAEPSARVAVALAAEADDVRVARDVPCDLGWLALDVPHAGAYAATVTGADLDRETELDIATPIVRWTLEAPP